MNGKMKTVTMMMVIGLFLMLVAGGAQAADDEKYADKHMRLAVKNANQGYDELDQVGEKLDAGKEKKAMRHFENAIDDFEQALVHFANAELGKENKGIVDDLEAGLDALKATVKSLENDKPKNAEEHYAKAYVSFMDAEAALQALSD